jgi:adenine-specific DNA-methyltransferase
MKYMGSKRAMLLNGLGTVIEREISTSKRFVDLFAGSAAVANHVAQNYDMPVLATDLQSYSVVLANAILCRRRMLKHREIWRSWYSNARKYVARVGWMPSVSYPLTRGVVTRHRLWCEKRAMCPLTAAYGGHYFSAKQAIWIEALRNTLPKSGTARSAALAALIQAASQCVASPGHTAQPFQPTRSALPFLQAAWTRSVASRTKSNFAQIAKSVSRQKGVAKRIDANVAARELKRTDLVFIDPPYSGVHYSRFYHVLESIAQNRCGMVSGVGRYPPSHLRPRSRYSVQTEAQFALDQLLHRISVRGAKVILTFPNHKCSNGLSGCVVQKIAARHFYVTTKVVASRFSTLGGTSAGSAISGGRDARLSARELVLTLTPRG